MSPLTLPRGRRGKTMALALLAAAVGAAWLGVASPLLSLHAAGQERLAQQQMLATRMARLVATLPELRRQAASTQRRIGPEPLLSGPTDAVAAAALQTRLQGMAGDAGASLSSVEALPAEAIGGLRRIGLRVALRAPLPVLIRLLRDVHGASPRMLVDDVQIRTGLIIRGEALPLDISFTVLAFRAGLAETAAR